MHELITIEIQGNELKGHGCKKYKTHPRIGEWVEMTDDQGKAALYEVFKVVHSDEGHGSDLYVKKVGTTQSVINTKLLNKSF
jgi:hypothetical protein